MDGTKMLAAVIDEQVDTKLGRRDILKRDGFLSIDRITDDRDIAHIRAICEDLFARKAGFREGRLFDMVGTDDAGAPKLPQILHPHLDAPELRRSRFFIEAERLAKELLGPDARFKFDHIIKKPPLDGAVTPWHQDEAFSDPAMDYKEVTIWLPLQPVDEHNGCMSFIPGTNRGELLPHRSPNQDTRVHAIECYTGFDVAAQVRCPLPIGGCTVHTERSVHGTGANISDHPRYAYIVVFQRPPQPRLTTRVFPWQAEKQTAGDARARDWMRKGGVVVLVWRKITKMWGRQIGGRMMKSR